ncbi:hypothetical protein CLOM_g1945 [Closterium sp. NIES-68]|nr:hypothetical protein CLOM_g1945 [Closterium sp. NIES-68]
MSLRYNCGGYKVKLWGDFIWSWDLWGLGKFVTHCNSCKLVGNNQARLARVANLDGLVGKGQMSKLGFL